MLASHIPRYLRYQTRKWVSYDGIVLWDTVLNQPKVTVVDKNIAWSRFQWSSLQFIMPNLKIQDTYLAFPRPSVLFCKMAILSLHCGHQWLSKDVLDLRVIRKIRIAKNIGVARKKRSRSQRHMRKNKLELWLWEAARLGGNDYKWIIKVYFDKGNREVLRSGVTGHRPWPISMAAGGWASGGRLGAHWLDNSWAQGVMGVPQESSWAWWQEGGV